MCTRDTVDMHLVDLEATRVLPRLRGLSHDNRDMLKDLVDGAAITELAEDYTSGDTHTLQRRLRNVLIFQLEFDPSTPMQEMVASLASAFKHEDERIS